MGPGEAKMSNLPSRPKFNWDIKSAPWTDGKGDQTEYKDAVKLWQSFHDQLPDGNNNKIPVALQAICLKSQLFGRAKDLCAGITSDQLNGIEGVNRIVNAIYKRDALSVVSEAYKSFNQLWNTKRTDTESMKSFEQRFAACVSKFNAISETTRLPECLTALMLLSNAVVEDSQRVSVLAAASPNEPQLGQQATNDQFLSAVTYQSVASVIKQCDNNHSSGGQNLSVNSATTVRNGRNNYRGKYNNRSNYSNGNFTSKKTMKYPCKKCGMYGHWKNEHLSDGSLPKGVKSFEKPFNNNSVVSSTKDDNNPSKTVSFNSAKLIVKKENELLESNDNLDRMSETQSKDRNSGDKINSIVNYNEDWSNSSSDIGPLPELPVDFEAKHVVKKFKFLYISSATVCANRISCTKHNTTNKDLIGPLVDDGAPYSAIGVIELLLMSDDISDINDIKMDPIPSCLEGYSHFQYGTGNHSSKARKIIGSVILTVKSDNSNYINIRHIVIEGSSQWVVGRNVTRRSNLNHIEQNAIAFIVGNSQDTITMIDHEFLSYIPISKFVNCKTDRLECMNGHVVSNRPWSEVKSVIDKVHNHVCGHANFTDFKILLERNNLWDKNVAKYVSNMIENCRACKSAAPTQPPRKVSISSLSKEINEIVCVDHFYLDKICLLHLMDLTTRFSVAQIVKSTALQEAVNAFEATWIAHFGYPCVMKGDEAFEKGVFREHLNELGIKFELVPKGRHYKNPIESKHSIIRSVFIRLMNTTNKRFTPEYCAIKAVSISNDLYGNNIMSAFEMSKGYTKSIEGNSLIEISPEIEKAYVDIQARRKLANIMKSKSVKELPLTVGDSVEIYQKDPKQKRGKWSIPKIIQDIDYESRIIKTIGKNKLGIKTPFEDVRLPVGNDDFSRIVSEAIHTLDDSIYENITTNGTSNDKITEKVNTEQQPIEDAEFTDDNVGNVPNVGDDIEVYWPLGDTFYPGNVESEEGGKFHIQYDDGSTEDLDMRNEVWNYHITSTATASVGNLKLRSNENEVLNSMFVHFGNKQFMKHEAQGFDQYPINNAYKIEEESFLKNVKVIPLSKISAQDKQKMNIIGSHTLYKLKRKDDKSLKIKGRIAPHGNEDALKELLTKDCTMCPPTGIRIVESTASLYGWVVVRGDSKSAFLQLMANRDVYVKPPRESSMRNTHLWLLLITAYGLVNSNAKWQNESDNVLLKMGLTQSINVPQLFYKKENGKLTLILAKVVDDIIAAGVGNSAIQALNEFDKTFKLGEIKSGPGKLRFFGINISQNEDRSIDADADDKTKDLFEYSISKLRRKQYEEPMNAIEKSAFMSMNSSLGWIGSSASPLFSFYSSYLQQKNGDLKVKHIIEQNNIIKKLRKYGSTISCPRPPLKKEFKLKVLVFTDASRSDENGQIGVIAGLMLGDLEEGSTFHLLSWMSHKTRRPVKSIPAAKILAASEGIDEGKLIKGVYKELFNTDVQLQICVDSKDLFNSMSTQRQSIDRSIRGDVACIRYEFQTGSVNEISWIPGKMNLADVLTKTDSPLSEALKLTMFNGKLCFNYSDVIETKSSERHYG